MSSNTKTFIPLFALAIVVALLLLACGSSETSVDVAEPAATAEVVPTTPPLEAATAVPETTAREAAVPGAGSEAADERAPTADQTDESDQTDDDQPDTSAAASATASDSTESGTATSTAAGINAAQWSSNVAISIGDSSFQFISNGLPSHELPDQFLIPNANNMPPFDGDDISAEFSIENTAGLIVESPLDVEITLNPVYSDDITLTGLSTIGVMISGVPLFNDYEDQNRQFVALDDNLSLDGVYFIDACNGHPLASGQSYHYHGVPYCITDAVDIAGQHSTIIGVLLDGFPIYGSKDVDGVAITNADLDECSGHFGPTPEFPNGIYHYHLTEDANPYSIDCFHGVIDYNSNQGPGDGPAGPPADGAEGGPPADAGPPADGAVGGNAGGPGGGGRPDFAQAATALGVTEAELLDALGGPPPDFDAAALALGMSVDDLQAALTAASS